MGRQDSFEYAIRKDVRNNPIVREVDERRQQQLRRWVGFGSLLVAVLLVIAWQQVELLRYGYRLDQMQRERVVEEEISRHLRLEIQTLLAPQRIEGIATGRLGMVAPAPDEAVVIERLLSPAPAASALVAAR